MFNPIVERKYIERDNNRVLLMIYDFIMFAAVFVLVFLMQPSDVREMAAFRWYDYLIQFVLAYGCLLIARLCFRCYKQILRYGNMRAFARLMAAEFTGGAVYVILERTLPIRRVLSIRAVLLILLDYAVILSARIIYYYIYLQAARETALGEVLRRGLEMAGGVDVESRKAGAVASMSQIFGMDEKTRVRNIPASDIIKVVRRFDVRGDVTDIRQITKGYINKTYRIETKDEDGRTHKYTLQRINTDVFTNPDVLMDNYMKVTQHLQGRFLLSGHTRKGSNPTIKPVLKNGKAYLRTDSGCWRMMNYFSGIYSMDIPDSPQTFYEAGKSFGLFLKAMSDMDISELKDTIPNFHNTRIRYRDLLAAIDDDPYRRVKDVVDEIKFIKDRSSRYGLIADALESGRIPKRITHNDCNLNNILFSRETHEPVAVIDLDTVMTGSPLYDYGDSMRIGTNTATDDETDLSKVSCDLKLYEAYARGYLEACGDILTEEELKLMPYASIIITSEDGIRFLMDHINGDTYYITEYAGQNLDRCRTQLKLVEDMEKKLPQIKEILRKIYAELGLKAEIAEEDPEWN